MAIYKHLILDNDLGEIYTEYKSQLQISNAFLLLLVFVLMLFNWFLETLKWNVLVNQHYSISIPRSFGAILMGVTTGIVSPNRIGEFAGRLLSLPKEYNLLSVKANVYNSLAQNCAIFIVASIAVFIATTIVESIESYFPIKEIIVIITVLWLIMYFTLESLLKNRFFRWINNRFNTWGNIYDYKFTISSKIKGLLFSVIRFITYSTQFYLLLQFFGLSSNNMEILYAVFIYYMFQSFLPLPPLLGVFAKGELALLVFSQNSVNELTILSATVTIWIINVVIPTLIGLILILRTRITESIGIR